MIKPWIYSMLVHLGLVLVYSFFTSPYFVSSYFISSASVSTRVSQSVHRVTLTSVSLKSARSNDAFRARTQSRIRAQTQVRSRVQGKSRSLVSSLALTPASTLTTPLATTASPASIVTEPTRGSTSGDVTGGPHPDEVGEIKKRIETVLEYPYSLRRRGIQGQVSLRIQLSIEGELQKCDVIKSSGHLELDRLAVSAVGRAAPFSAQLKTALILPIDFKIRE